MFEYNKNGKLAVVDDWTGKNIFELDALNRIVKVNDHNDKVVRYSYDEVGNQTSIDYPDETSVTYQYNLLKQMVGVTDADNSTIHYQYDKVGRKISMKYPNRRSESYSYDAIGKLLKVTGTDERNSEYILNKYEYDPQGNVIREFKLDIGGNEHQSINYGYDELNRLTMAKEQHGYFERLYSYDSLGNLVFENDGGNTVRYSIDGLNRLVSKTVGGSEVYNYTYDKRGNLIKESSSLNNTVLASYVYDITNRIIKGTNKDGESSIYNFNALGVLINHTDRVNKDYTVDYTAFVPRELVEIQDSKLDYKYVYGGRNRISADINTGVERVKMLYHNDRLGSTVYLTDNLGKIQAMANYDEWGNRTKVINANIFGNDFDLARSYTGHWYD